MTRQVLPDGEAAEDVPALWDYANPPMGDLVTRQMRNILVGPDHLPFSQFWRAHAGDGPDQTGLTHPVSSEQGHDLAVPDLEVYSSQDLRGPIPAVNTYDA